MNTSKAFDSLVEKYYQTYGANPEYNYFVDQLVDVVRKGRVLDIGCGAGLPVAKRLSNQGYDVVGIDVSKKMIEAARHNVPKGVFYQEDMEKFELGEESYDGVCAFFSFNHVKKKDAPKVIDRIKKGLKEGGGFLIGVLEGSFEGKGTVLGVEMFISHYTEDELKILLKDFHMVLFEKREFSIQGETVQNQIFALVTKRPQSEDFAEQLIQEVSKEQADDANEPDEKEDDNDGDQDDGKKPKKTNAKQEKKEDPEDEPDEDELPAIRITLGPAKGRKKKTQIKI